MTYDATVRVPAELMAVMSAESPTEKNADGVYRFRMPQPIPSVTSSSARWALEVFLTGMGRRKFLKPLYRRLAESEDTLAMAQRIYDVARPGYHSMSTNTIDEILGR